MCVPVCVCLQTRVEQAGLSLTLDALIDFLKFCSDNYERPEFKGNLPAVLYLEDTRSFVVCT